MRERERRERERDESRGVRKKERGRVKERVKG